MKVLVTGASGMVGTQLLQAVREAGHAPFRLLRSRPSPGDRDPTWDPAAGQLDAAALEGFDVVVHLSGESIGASRWSRERKKRIRDSRVDSTRLLSGTLAQLQRPPKVLVCASAVGFYGDRGDQALDEQAPPGTGFLSDVCREWEAASSDASAAGIRTVHLRFGIILSATGGALSKMMPPFRFGLGGPIGNARQYMSWVTLDDTIAIIGYAMENDAMRGPVNVVAPQAVRNAEFTKALGRVMRRPAFLPLPALAVRLLFGEMGEALLLASTRAMPSVLLQSGYTFRHPELEGALEAVLSKKP
jgi:uncharacterized protein (TIGR01777 family)